MFNTRESNYDTALGVYTGSSLTGLTQLAVNDQYNGNQSRVVVPVTAGTTYRIAVDGWGDSTGNLGLQWSVNRPANDDFGAPRELSNLSGIVSASSVRATGEPGELDYHGGAIADNSVWFRWTPSQSGPAIVRMSGISPTLAPGLEVYTGSSLSGLTSIVEAASTVSFNAVAGTQYRIAVDGNGGSTGSFQLEWLMASCNGLPATITGSGVINGTAGDDVIVGSAANDTINAGAGNDTVCALGGNDGITGGLGNDHERGGVGNDTHQQGAVIDGADFLMGETGIDTVNYGARSAPLNVSMGSAIANDGQAGEGDNVHATIDNLVGGTANDVVSGNALANRISGLAGNDQLRGHTGNDTVIGGAGADRLFGEAGNDALNLVDGVSANDRGDGGLDIDSAVQDAGDTVINVP